MIKKIVDAFKKINTQIPDEDIECAIDDQTVECEGEAFKQDALNYYTGVPAPAYLEDDPWFGPAPVRSEKQLDYLEQETLSSSSKHRKLVKENLIIFIR